MKGSIKFQLTLALAVQFLLLSFIVAFTLYALELRKHDYTILNLAGQLRVMSQTMATQSMNYVENAPRDYETYDRDLGLYSKDLNKLITNYDHIIESFKERELHPELWNFSAVKSANATENSGVLSLLGAKDVIYCSWDKASRNQLDVTAEVWDSFKSGLLRELGEDKQAPRLEYAAIYIIENEQKLMQASTDLAATFRTMMEAKLEEITRYNRIAMALSFVTIVVILLILYRNTFNPLDRTVKAFTRVARGDLQHQVEVSGSTEITSLIKTFNMMTRRLESLFQLTDRIHQATTLDDTLKFVFEEFSSLLPIDWVGMLFLKPGEKGVVLERQYAGKQSQLHEKDTFSLANSPFSQLKADSHPLIVNHTSSQYIDNDFLSALSSNGFHASIFFPMSIKTDELVVLVFAADQIEAYQEEHIELLENIATQVGHAFDKTIGMESLVISAVEGLAKLAENRDPETGDHLVRMSLYSAIIAEQLSDSGPYQEQLSPAYVRDVFRFAPMHDIGKVGVPDSILLKPGRLDEDERKQMEIHPVTGAEVLRRCEEQVQLAGYSIFSVGIEIAEAHHEKFDGSGYPYQLAGDDIPLSARIVAAADVFDALTSKRPYKEAWDIDRAMELMREQAGLHFDPVVIEAFEQAMPRVLQVYQQHKHV